MTPLAHAFRRAAAAIRAHGAGEMTASERESALQELRDAVAMSGRNYNETGT